MRAHLRSALRRSHRAGGTLAALVALLLASVASIAAQSSAPRPMTFLDAQNMARAGSWTPSPDGMWMLYTVSYPDWKEADRQSDLHLVSLERGIPSHKQMTFTEEKNETSPAWSPDGSWFVFLSDREGTQNQLFLMYPDGGEARRITDAKEGVSNFEFSPDGRWLVYRSGRSGEAQLYRMPVEGFAEAEAEPITKHPTGIDQWEWAPDGERIYFTSPDTLDPDERLRTEKRFTVDIKNPVTPLTSLW